MPKLLVRNKKSDREMVTQKRVAMDNFHAGMPAIMQMERLVIYRLFSFHIDVSESGCSSTRRGRSRHIESVSSISIQPDNEAIDTVRGRGLRRCNFVCSSDAWVIERRASNNDVGMYKKDELLWSQKLFRQGASSNQKCHGETLRFFEKMTPMLVRQRKTKWVSYKRKLDTDEGEANRCEGSLGNRKTRWLTFYGAWSNNTQKWVVLIQQATQVTWSRHWRYQQNQGAHYSWQSRVLQ